MAARPPAGDDQGALDQLEAVLAEAVSRRMVADVPIGSFLSGGIDSSLVTALAQAGSTDRCAPSRWVSPARGSTRRTTQKRWPGTSAPPTPGWS